MRKKTPERVQIAVIGGSGLYAIPGVADVQELRVPTPFGVPSDKISVGRLSGVRCSPRGAPSPRTPVPIPDTPASAVVRGPRGEWWGRNNVCIPRSFRDA